MKRFIVACFCMAAIAIAALPSPALATGDPAAGAAIFSANCNACHIGGGNAVMSMKTLKKDALNTYLANFQTDGVDAIIYQVKNGKGAMPAFGGRLSDQEIENVAAYVLDQAEKGW